MTPRIKLARDLITDHTKLHAETLIVAYDKDDIKEKSPCLNGAVWITGEPTETSEPDAWQVRYRGDGKSEIDGPINLDGRTVYVVSASPRFIGHKGPWR